MKYTPRQVATLKKRFLKALADYTTSWNTIKFSADAIKVSTYHVEKWRDGDPEFKAQIVQVMRDNIEILKGAQFAAGMGLIKVTPAQARTIEDHLMANDQEKYDPFIRRKLAGFGDDDNQPIRVEIVFGPDPGVAATSIASPDPQLLLPAMTIDARVETLAETTDENESEK